MPPPATLKKSGVPAFDGSLKSLRIISKRAHKRKRHPRTRDWTGGNHKEEGKKHYGLLNTSGGTHNRVRPPRAEHARNNRDRKLGTVREDKKKRDIKVAPRGHGQSPADDRVDSSTGRHPEQKVDGETLQYYAEISSLLGMGNSMTGPEDRATLCANALEETQGKECELCCDSSCSRVLEMLVLSCDIIQVVSFLHRISPFFSVIANDASGSHVVEALLKSAAAALHTYNGESAWYKTLTQALVAICQVVGERAVDMMSNCYGSHVVRSLLSLLSGAIPETSSHKKSGRPIRGLAGRLFIPPNVGNDAKHENSHFPDLLHALVEKLLGEAKKNITQLCKDPFVSPVLQAILKILEGDAAAVVKAIKILLDYGTENVMKDGNALGAVPCGNLKQLIFDNSSSHLVEVMLEVAPDAVYLEMFQQICYDNLLEISLHRSANFVVQALIKSARHEDQVNALVANLGAKFWDLIKESRSGVITSLLIACKRIGTHEQEACRSLAQAINPESAPPACLVPRLLFLESYAISDGAAHWKPGFGKKMSVLGCAMLQTIFSYPSGCSQQFWLSLTALESVDILATVKDPGGCHVVESFLSAHVPLKHKNKVISKLQGHFAELALVSSFTLEKCFSVGNIGLKEAITSELVTLQSDLAKTKHGPHLIKKFDVIGYSRMPDQWKARMSAKQGALKDFSDMFNQGNQFETSNGKSHTNRKFGADISAVLESRPQSTKQDQKEQGKFSDFAKTGMGIVQGADADAFVITNKASGVGKSRKRTKII